MPIVEKEGTTNALVDAHFGTRRVLVLVEDGRDELRLASAAAPLVLQDFRVAASTPAHAFAALDIDGAYDLVVVDVDLPGVTLTQLRTRLADFSPSIPLIVLREESAAPAEAVREIGRRVLAELVARKTAARVATVLSEDPSLTRALAAREAFASEVQSAVAEHHRAGREVVVEREGKLVRLSPPRM